MLLIAKESSCSDAAFSQRWQLPTRMPFILNTNCPLTASCASELSSGKQVKVVRKGLRQ